MDFLNIMHRRDIWYNEKMKNWVSWDTCRLIVLNFKQKLLTIKWKYNCCGKIRRPLALVLPVNQRQRMENNVIYLNLHLILQNLLPLSPPAFTAVSGVSVLVRVKPSCFTVFHAFFHGVYGNVWLLSFTLSFLSVSLVPIPWSLLVIWGNPKADKVEGWSSLTPKPSDSDQRNRAWALC